MKAALYLVSHDRYFISKTANKIWEIVDHEIKEFKGTYQEWVEWKERMAKQQNQRGKNTEIKEEKIKKKDNSVNNPPKQETVNSAQKKELQKLQKQFSKLEEDINQFNQKKAGLEKELAIPENYTSGKKFIELETAYKKIQADLASANQEYETLFEKIMELEAGEL